MRLDTLPRFVLGALPTPLQRAERLSAAAGVEVFIKRDDLTGLGLGGNKVRKLEYLVADALARGADTLVTGGGPQSNHAALTALAAARAGLSCSLVFYGTPYPGRPEGNGRLYGLAGAQVSYTGSQVRSSVDPALQQTAFSLEHHGRTPYVIPRGGATALGCAGYLRASRELAGQLGDLGVAPTRLVVATGSCGTQAGLELGARWLQASYRVVGVTVSRPRAECVERVHDLSQACAELVGLDVRPVNDAVVLDGYIGQGYGKPTDEGRAATELLARTEGLVLDPVFTAKAMAALLDLARDDDGPVVFWHTGGAPTAFVDRLAM